VTVSTIVNILVRRTVHVYVVYGGLTKARSVLGRTVKHDTNENRCKISLKAIRVQVQILKWRLAAFRRIYSANRIRKRSIMLLNIYCRKIEVT